MASFRLIERGRGDGWHEVGVEGELDLAVADQLERAISSAHRGGTLIDLTACEFIDSTGIAVLVRGHREAPDDAPLLLYGANEQVLRALEVTGLTGTGLLFDTADAAIAAASASR